VADLVVRHAPLRGIDVPVELVPDMIDEFFSALFVAAAWRVWTHARAWCRPELHA
jgi:hypothetical protein